jgi:MFS family permease
MLGGCLALAVGAGVTIAAIETGTAAVLLLGTGIAGLGYGPAFTGAYRTVVALAPEDDRAGLIAAIFTLSYLSSGVPALIAGITAEQFGLHGTALVYSAAVAGLAAAAGTFLTRHGSRTGKPHIQQLLPHPPGPCTMPRYTPAAHEEATRYRGGISDGATTRCRGPHETATPWTAPGLTRPAEWNWQVLAACRSVDPDLFFPVSSTEQSRKQAAEAKAFCTVARIQPLCR